MRRATLLPALLCVAALLTVTPSAAMPSADEFTSPDGTVVVPATPGVGLPTDLVPTMLTASPASVSCAPATGERFVAIVATPSDVQAQPEPNTAHLRRSIEHTSEMIRKHAAAADPNVDLRLRVECDADGRVTVKHVALSKPTAELTFSSIYADLWRAGFKSKDAKYLVMVTACLGQPGAPCQEARQANLSRDDRASAQNRNNSGPSYALHYAVGGASVPNWAYLAAATVRTMGAIQLSAPNSDGAYGCTDGQDLLCPSSVGGACVNTAIDCNKDDYFHPSPAPGSYLATHWNVASPVNRFLDRRSVTPGPATAAAGPQVRRASLAGGSGREVRLAVGEPVFWERPALPASSANEDRLRGRAANCVAGSSCEDVVLHVDAAAGQRLRVALDYPFALSWVYDLALYGPGCGPDDPGCPEYLSPWKHGAGLVVPAFSMEIDRALDEGPSTWTARAFLLKRGVPDRPYGYRLRAIVQNEADVPDVGDPLPVHDVAAPAPGPTDELLLPNLRMEPPLRLGFRGAFPDDGPSTSCRADEQQFDGATTCLRFDFGWDNVGDGPFRVALRQPPTGVGDARRPVEGEAFQQVLTAEGVWREFEGSAGTWHHHTEHNHFHFSNFFHGRLYRVSDGAMTEFVPAHAKIGGCSHDWKLADFGSFANVPLGSQDSGATCGAGGAGTPAQTSVGLSTMWADVYDRGNAGNMVDLGPDPEPGRYVIQFEADPAGLVRETVEDDNVAYAYVEVFEDPTAAPYGLGVRLLERGRGHSPFDADREILPMRMGCDWVDACPADELLPPGPTDPENPKKPKKPKKPGHPGSGSATGSRLGWGTGTPAAVSPRRSGI